MRAVVDTSVALKWYVQESDSAAARPLLQQELVAPDFILLELANALWKKMRLGQIGSDQAKEALAHIAQTVRVVPSAVLIEEALGVAEELLHPVYDCLYLVLARELRVPLVTSDRRLCDRAQRSDWRKIVVPLNEWERRND